MQLDSTTRGTGKCCKILKCKGSPWDQVATRFKESSNYCSEVIAVANMDVFRYNVAIPVSFLLS